ncbi:hypothetical protein [Streptomyces sp. NRRL S-37]|nr:hypothetical protein [Streptomyces sp. NRRL S-37]
MLRRADLLGEARVPVGAGAVAAGLRSGTVPGVRVVPGSGQLPALKII